ncbi:FtsX-like permease family protein [Mollicutes bacterium LVI A0039]|nr:FtsX-like permease family protein [Mollicutes bacterium LVI A0039]
MNIFKRALINIGANKGKTLLLFVIFFTSMFAITMNNIVNETYDKLLEEAFPDGDVPLYVQPNFSMSVLGGAKGGWEEQKTITKEMYDEMANLDTVSRVEKSMNTYVNNVDFEMVEGAYDSSIAIQFADDQKSFELSEGVTYDFDPTTYATSERPIVLNDELLELNNLSVGDKITFDFSSSTYNSDGQMMSIDELKAVEYTIVGSYHFEPTPEMIAQEQKWAEEYNQEPDLSFAYYKMSAYMPIKNADELIQIIDENGGDSTQTVYTNYTIYVTELSQISKFKEEAKKIAGFELDIDVNYWLQSDTDFSALESILQARYTIERVFVLLIVVVGIMLVIIAIILIRGRRKEIGILIALGERRKNVYFQMVFEQILIMLVATFTAFPTATIALRRIANTYASVDLPLVISPLFISLLAGLAIVLVSTLIPAIYTMRVNPKKILL